MSTHDRQPDPRTAPGRSGVRLGIVILLLTVVAVGCGGGRDDRDGIRQKYGEPDDVEYMEGPISDYETWTYFDLPDEGQYTQYIFERARNTCGANRNWILYRSHTYTPAEGGRSRISVDVPGGYSGPNPIRP